MFSGPDWGNGTFKKSAGLDPRVNSSGQSGSWEAKPTGRGIAGCDSHSVQERANHLDTFV
jgi:hypothetical protein